MAGDKGTVCVTGGTGYIGSWLIMRLLDQGYHVRTTIRSDPGKPHLCQGYIYIKKKLTYASPDYQGVFIYKSKMTLEGIFILYISCFSSVILLIYIYIFSFRSLSTSLQKIHENNIYFQPYIYVKFHLYFFS